MKPHALLRFVAGIGSFCGVLVLSACAGSGNESSSSSSSSSSVSAGAAQSPAVATVVSTTISTFTEAPVSASSSSAPATPTPVPVDTESSAPLCATSQLAVFLGDQDGAAGSTYINIIFINIGATECVLQGYPGVSLVGFGNGTQIGAPAARDFNAAPLISLPPGISTSSRVRITRAENFDPSWCSPQPIDGLRIYPPEETHAAFVPLSGFSGCSNPEVELLSTTAVGI